MSRRLCAVLIGILAATGFGAAPSQAQEKAVQWCQIDDPADWRLAREALIAKDERDLSNIPCPEKQTGESLPEQLTLPMPCGRAFVFRRIDVPVSHALDQVAGSFGRSVDIAVETPQTVLSNGPWIQPVAGVFSVGKDGKQASSDALDTLTARAYYIGKYELLDLQWALFELGMLDLPFEETQEPESEACAPFRAALEEANLRRIRPKGGLSWFDAVAFSRAYSNWLLSLDQTRREAGQAPVLPWEQGATGYVRLPTEAEWEFAARGGATFVTPQSRSVRLPMVVKPDTGEAVQGELSDVCTEPPRDQDFKLAAVGRTQANTLGLYDVVCNAEELVLDLFRLTRPDGLGGQVGGIITKGGNSILLREQNTVGRRSEAQALFNTQGEAKTSTVGTRLAISAPVFVGRRDENSDFVEGRPNQVHEAAMMSGRQTLLDSGVGINDDNDSKELEAQVNKLRREISEGQLTQSELQDRATQLQVELDRLNVRLRQATTDEVLLSIRSAVITANLIDRIGRNMFAGMDRVEKLRETRPQTADTEAALTRAQAALVTNRTRISASFDVYLQVHSELAQLEEAFVVRQIADTRRGLGGTKTEVFGQYLTLFEQHHKEIRTNRGRITETMRKTWLISSTRPILNGAKYSATRKQGVKLIEGEALMKMGIVNGSRKITGAGLIAAMLLTACDEAIVLSPADTNKADSCSKFRTQIAAARRTELDKQAQGAAVGAVLGALVGAAAAGSSNRGQGALIGAAAGGLVGYSAVYSQQVQARSKDANSLLSNVNSDAGKERALVTQTGRAAVALQKCRRAQLASLRSRVTSGKTEKATARNELRAIKSWVDQDNRIVSAAFNGIGKRVDAYVDVTNATAKTQRSISTSSARARTPNVARAKNENVANRNSYNRGQEAVARDIQVLDVLLG